MISEGDGSITPRNVHSVSSYAYAGYGLVEKNQNNVDFVPEVWKARVSNPFIVGLSYID